jgi:hypothetical protein
LEAGKMENTIQIKHIRGGSLFKLLIIGNTVFFIPLSIVMGIANYFGLGQAAISLNQKPLTGLTGLIASPFTGVFFAIVISAFLWVVIFVGLWIYTKFKPVELEFIPFAQEDDE